jgi:hypothetical protein
LLGCHPSTYSGIGCIQNLYKTYSQVRSSFAE